ncbi:MAG: cache domain-containing protein [Methyloligellaceae bacterium]
MAESKNERQVTIRIFLIIPFAVLFATMIAALTLLAFQKGNDAVEQIKVKIRERTLLGVRSQISEYMNTAHRLNKATANYIAKGRLDINDPVALQDFFWNQLKVYENVNYIYFGYKDGGIVLIARRSDGTFVVRETGLSDGRFMAGTSKVYALGPQGRRANLIRQRDHFDSRTRPWFKKAVLHKGPIWTEVYPFFLEKTLGITAARPLYGKDGQFLGVISTDILLSTFHSVLEELKPTDLSELFIVEKDGTLIASTSDHEIVQPQGGVLSRIKASESKSQIIRAAYKRYASQPINISTDQPDIRRFDVSVNGEQHLVEFFPYKDQLGIEWLIGLTVSEQEILGPGRKTLWLIIYFGLGTLIFSIILCVFLGERLALPLLNLHQVARDVADGSSSARAVPSKIIELNTLSSSFNFMADKIQSYVAELEMKNADLNSQIRQRKETEKKLRYFKEEVDIKQRTKMAGELHDGIGQSLQAINLGLKMMEKNTGGSGSGTVKFSDLISEVGMAIEQLRDIIDRQYPVFLDQMDIQTAIEHYGRKRAERSGLEFTFKSNIQRLDLEPIYKEPIFLIFQEALNNSVKYAKAKNVTVSMKITSDYRFEMKIHDDGIGFDVENLKRAQKGLGLSLMSERAQSIGGTLDIISKPGDGSCVTMEISLND